MKIWSRLKKIGLGLCVVCLLVPVGSARSMNAYGAESSVIEKVTVTLKTTYGEPEDIPEPAITVSGTGCSLGEVIYRTDYDKWKPGKKVRVEIMVDAAEGKLFPTSLNSSQCKVTGASFVSARASEDRKLKVSVEYTPVMVLGGTGWAGWSSANSKMAVWEKVDYATGYSVNLYGDNKSIKKLTVSGTSADLSDYIKDDDKTYFYEVKAIPTTADEKKYLKEGVFVASVEEDDGQINWNGNTRDGGSIKGDNYILPDGRKEANTWKQVSEKWYYFDGNGNMTRGWGLINGAWYYMNQSGVMQTGWVNPAGDSWFYMDGSGKMCTGWIQPNPNEWYYLNGSGYMQRGWGLINGKWYYFNNDGKMQTGWIQVAGTWYFLYNDGSMAMNTSVDGWTITASGAAYR